MDVILIVRFWHAFHDISAKQCRRKYSSIFCEISRPERTSKQAIPLYSYVSFTPFIKLLSNPYIPLLRQKSPGILAPVVWNYYVYVQMGKTDFQCSIFINYYTTVKLGNDSDKI